MSEDTTKTPEELAAEQEAAEKANLPIESDAVNDFINSYLSDTAKKKEKAPPAEKSTEKASEKKAAPKRKAAAPAARQTEPEVDYEKLAAAAGEGAARAIAASRKEEKPEKAKEGEELVSQRKLQVLTKMGELDEKYKGLANRYVDKMKQLKSYADKWQKDNPEEEFNEDDEEHAEFIEKLESEIDYDEDAYAEALADIKYEEREAKKKKEPAPEDPEIAEIKLKHKREKRSAEIVAARDEAGNHFWEQMGQEFSGVVKEDGSLDTELLKAIQDEEPEKYDEAVAAFHAVEALSQECFMLSEQLVDYDPKNKAHAMLSNFALEREADMMEMAETDRVDGEGRTFLPKNQFERLSAAQSKKHWTFSYADISRMLAARLAAAAQDRIKAEQKMFERMAKARGIPLPAKEKPGVRQKQSVSERERENGAGNEDEKPETPSLRVESRLASAKQKGAVQPKTGLQAFVDGAID